VWRRLKTIAESQNPVFRDKAHALAAQLARHESDRETWLAESYRLTPSEARLAAHIAGGGSVAGYASKYGVSQGTARTHLKAVFAKTSVHRQSDLVRLLARQER
jgi:DNA-binding CsgD family transcriptional regulator